MGHSWPLDGHIEWRRLATRHRNAFAFLSLIVLLAIGTLLFPDSGDDIGGVALLLTHLTAGTTALLKSRRKQGRDRRAWTLIGLGMSSAGTGVLVLAVLQSAGVAVPAFGPIDLFFLTAYSLILTGTVSLPNAFRGQRDILRILIDGIVGAISFGTLLWLFLVEDVLQYFAGATSWDRWVGTAYPLLDVVTIVVFVTLLSRRSRYRMDPRLGLMAGGAMLQAVSDLAYLSSGIGSTFAEAEPPYVLFIAAALMLAAASYLSDYVPPTHEFAPRVVHILSTAAPYGIALSLVLATLLALPDAGFDQTTRLLTASTIGVGTLVIFRQALAIRDNRIHVDQKRSDLVASVSHELRTPLTAVVGVLALLKDMEAPPSPEEMDELVSMAYREANRMSRIVADVTLLTRIDPQEMGFAETPTVVAELIEESLETIDTNDAEVRLSVDADLTATLDRGRVQQVLTNLVENAGRYGRGEVQVVAFDAQGSLVIEVHDNGPGVPKRDRTVIWERFERGAHRFNAAIPGSGIGLAVVAAIAAAHGGEATYRDSERLGGACFAIELPGRSFHHARSRSEDHPDGEILDGSGSRPAGSSDLSASQAALRSI